MGIGFNGGSMYACGDSEATDRQIKAMPLIFRLGIPGQRIVGAGR